MTSTDPRRQSAIGALLGTAVGDALGLPAENLSPKRLARLFPSLIARPDGSCDLHHSFLFGRGMVSDDTDHACMTALAIASSGGSPDRFGMTLGWYLRFWFAAIPAGIGMATARACIKLWLGYSPASSGVWSAGNGPCMRSPLIGVVFADNPVHLRSLVGISTRLTHSDPKAEAGALAIALAARMAAGVPGPITIEPLLHELRQDSRQEFSDLAHLLEKVAASVSSGKTTPEFAIELGLSGGVTGYVLHTVPCVIHAWLRHPRDFSRAMAEIISCGGDTDTTAAILGGIVGAGVGPDALPAHLLESLTDWPWTIERIKNSAIAAYEAGRDGKPRQVPLLIWPLIFLRNMSFLSVVLAHGFRRLLPPY